MVTDVQSCLPSETTSPAAFTAAYQGADRGESRSIPTLGFTGYVVPGQGEYVLSVQPGSMAQRIGLARGDMLLSVNDRLLTREGAWRRAMAPSASGKGRVTLRFRHGQTGVVSSQTLHLFSAVGSRAASGYVRSWIRKNSDGFRFTAEFLRIPLRTV